MTKLYQKTAILCIYFDNDYFYDIIVKIFLQGFIMKKVNIFTSSLMLLALGASLFAKPIVDPSAMHKKMAQMTKEKAFFAPHEKFPKDYFLITKNLPFMVGLTLHHPQSSTLGLSKDQIDKIQAIKKTTVPKVVKIAKEIRGLELKLTENVVFKDDDFKSQSDLINKIASLKVKLTQKHIQCIQKVKKILTKKQFEMLVNYASKPKAH